MSAVDKLKTFSTVVADTGEFSLIKQFSPQDSTTNPSLILQASQKPEYKHLYDQAIKKFVDRTDLPMEERVTETCDYLFVLFGIEILKHIPGRVSIECDPMLSFDTEGSITKGMKFVDEFKKVGINADRLYIKLATTWEGLMAAKHLQESGIKCNMTLIFSTIQAVAAATISNAALVSPFIGRVTDWHSKNGGKDSYEPEEDPGVLLVINIHNYYKAHKLSTKVMGASFRNVGQVVELSGMDLMTIPPKVLTELQNYSGPIEQKLSATPKVSPPTIDIGEEKTFRWLLNQDACATDKLADGIRKFAQDQAKLRKMVHDDLLN